MADLWELTKYVEAHPENTKERWRLAKKLYKDGDYRLAIEHLQILLNEWKDKSSIPRYLAATYTRLSRTNEAVKVLESAVEKWPTDANIWEQLAVSLTANGQKEEASAAWAKVLESDPEHSFAQKAREALLRGLDRDFKETPVSQPVVGGNDKIICSQCGAENSPELLSCFNCNSSLDLVGDIIGEISDDEVSPLNIFPNLAKVFIVVGLLFGGYMTNAAYSFEQTSDTGFTIPHTLYEVLSVDLIATHLLLGVALIIAWPFLNQGAQYAAGIRRIQTDDSILQSFVLSVGAFALSWFPGVGVTAWVIVMLIFTFCVTLGIFRKELKQAVVIWGVQCTFVGILIGTLLVAMHGAVMVKEMPAMEQFVNTHPTVSSLDLSQDTKFTQELSWESTGSGWADDLVNVIGIRLTIPESSLGNNVLIEFKNSESVIVYHRLTAVNTVLYIEDIVPGLTYALRLDAEASTPVSVFIAGVLPVVQN